MRKVLLILCIIWIQEAHAGINASLQNFYSGIGANVTPAGVYQSQAGGQYTGGGLFMRTPTQSYNLLTVTPPSLSAGCGGIDTYLGGFSFINASQFTGMLQNIGNNAVGYAFNLAIQTFAPQIYSTLNELQAKIQKVNDFNINSCESAQKMVDGVFGEISANSNYACKNLALSKGLASDEAAAKQYCQNPVNARNVLNPQSMTASEKENTVVHKNLLWHGLSKNSIMNADVGMKEYLLSLVGTVTITTSTGGTPQYISYPPLGTIDNEVHTVMYGSGATPVLMYHCIPSDLDCVSPTVTGVPVTGIVSDVRTALDEIRINLESEATTGASLSPLSSQTQNLLAISSIPILKMMVNAVALGPSVALEIENELIEPVAFNISAYYLDWAFTTAKESIQQVKNAPKGMFQQYIATVRDRQRDFENLKRSKNITSSYEIIKKAQFLERMLVANLSPHFQEVMQYSKSF